jgi:glycosyltransferase involved in cell wall biosynthesis
VTQALEKNLTVDAKPQPRVQAGFSPTNAAVPHRLKVLFFYQDFGAMGGIERYLLQTAFLLRERGNIEPVFACCAGTPLARRLHAEGFRVHGLPNRPIFTRSIWRMLDGFTLWSMLKILREERPDIVHVHIGVLENLLFRGLGFPVVYTVHGYSTLYSLQDVTNPLKKACKQCVRWMFRKTARGVNALLFVSVAEQRRMLREGFMDRNGPARVLHNGVPVAMLQRQAASTDREQLRQRLGIPGHARVISFINRMDANKNPLHFVALARRIAQDPALGDLHFLMAGDGPLLEPVRAAVDDLPQCYVLGFYPNVAELLAISDLLVYPARREGFGLGLVEAMAVGVPCVAYASGGASEILDVGETSQCLVPVDDEAALLSAACRMLLLPEAGRLALQEALRQRAESFDCERFIEQLEAVYQEVAPKVSVILPVYQGEQTILKAVRSVLSQTYPHLELLVVDDGSTDGTLAVLATVTDPRLKVFRQENRGVASARNYGFAQASGEYIAFIDADDVWLPQKLAMEMETIRNQPDGESKVCLVYSGYYAVDDQDRLTHLPGIYRESGDLSQSVLAHEGIFLPSTALVHRAVFEAVGGFQADCYHEDRVFFIEACRQFPAYPTGRRLVIYRQSLSGRCRRILKDYDHALRAELSIVDTLRPMLSEAELARLTLLQLRNLLFRFLMYGEMSHARRIAEQLQQADAPPDLFAGKKGLLVRLSLKTGIHFLAGARRVIQALTRMTLMPWWSFKTRFLRRYS